MKINHLISCLDGIWRWLVGSLSLFECLNAGKLPVSNRHKATKGAPLVGLLWKMILQIFWIMKILYLKIIYLTLILWYYEWDSGERDWNWGERNQGKTERKETKRCSPATSDRLLRHTVSKLKCILKWRIVIRNTFFSFTTFLFFLLKQFGTQ